MICENHKAIRYGPELEGLLLLIGEAPHSASDKKPLLAFKLRWPHCHVLTIWDLFSVWVRGSCSKLGLHWEVMYTAAHI